MVWWAYSSCKISLTAPRVEGSNPGLSTSFIWSFNATTRYPHKAVCKEEKECDGSAIIKAAGAANLRRTGRRFRDEYEKGEGSGSQLD